MQTRCPHCKKVFKVTGTDLGRQAKCKCLKIFTVSKYEDVVEQTIEAGENSTETQKNEEFNKIKNEYINSLQNLLKMIDDFEIISQSYLKNTHDIDMYNNTEKKISEFMAISGYLTGMLKKQESSIKYHLFSYCNDRYDRYFVYISCLSKKTKLSIPIGFMDLDCKYALDFGAVQSLFLNYKEKCNIIFNEDYKNNFDRLKKNISDIISFVEALKLDKNILQQYDNEQEEIKKLEQKNKEVSDTFLVKCLCLIAGGYIGILFLIKFIGCW